MNILVPLERIENRIYLIRGEKVMLDKDLAELYGVKTSRLNEQVKRNLGRFPADFMFRLTWREQEELALLDREKNLKSQIATSRWGGRRSPVHVFAESGVAMLSSVLHSERAIQVNIAIMRAFTRLRRLLASNRELGKRIAELERKYSKHEVEISAVFKLLRKLSEPAPERPVKRIGFLADC
jgi:hypothetical protein